MISYVVVLENDAYALSAPDGSFTIEGVPPGEHVVNAWIPGAQRTSQPVLIEAGGVVDVAFELRQTERVAPHKRKDGSDYPKERYGEQ
jgi:hypothetical protein